MPKLYEYLGIIIFFWSNEHEPIHVHGQYQGRESRAEIIIQEGQVVRVEMKSVKGRRPLKGTELKNFEKVVVNRADEIVQKWIEYFVLHKKIHFEKITRKMD